MPNILEVFEKDMKDGLETSEFLRRYEEVFSYIREDQDRLKNFRLGKDPLKKFRDELTPCKRFIKHYQTQYLQIRSPLNSTYPDCFVVDRNGSEKEIEITITQGAERAVLMKELNEKGEGRGFIGLTDKKTHSAHKEAMKQPRSAYSTEQAIQCAVESIGLCVKKKNESKVDGINRKRDVLLIEHHLLPLPPETWRNNLSKLKCATENSMFQEVFLVGLLENNNDICWPLFSLSSP